MDILPQVSINGFEFETSSTRCCSSQKFVSPHKPSNTRDSRNFCHLVFQATESQQLSYVDSSPPSDGDHLDNSDYAVLKYINDMLMEEDLEGQTCMLQDSLALQAAEKSFYDVLNKPSIPDHDPCFLDQNYDYPDEILTKNFRRSRQSSYAPVSSLVGSNPYIPASHCPESPEIPGFVSILHGVHREPIGIMGNLERRYHRREDDDYLENERRNKQPAISHPDMEEPEIFDAVLLCNEDKEDNSSLRSQNHKKNRYLKGSMRSKRYTNQSEAVDLWTLLTQCAQAVASFDQRTATEILKQIRLHSSQFGDGTQRMAFYFAEALETRLVGTRAPVYLQLLSSKMSVVDILEAYKVFVEACPFRRMSDFLVTRTILKLAEKATMLHIIDFGILYGFQWPCLIQTLSRRPGGPPKLRITGIELPQPGFRPAEPVEETGRRLKRYCEMFNVPFEYNFIVKKWETLKVDDLKIDRGEMTVVACTYRLRNVPDETIAMNCPRDTVLKLIRDINPDLFLQGEVNGTYNSPFFMTRFREALFHFSALFDMYEATIPREEQHRMMLEREIFARDAINAIACEGTERVERPETYRQWHVRNLRAGFKQMDLDDEIIKKIKAMVRSYYHRDFVIDVNGQWMLQGWKGRVLYALSCWQPV